MEKILNVITIENSDIYLPIVPFFWYREQELYSPVNYCKQINSSEYVKMVDLIKKLYNIQVYFNIEDALLLVLDHVLDENIYLSFHTYLYYKENNNNIIPNNYDKNWNISIILKDLLELKDIELNGSVHIHDNAFSPPGCMCIKLRNDKQIYVFYLEYLDQKILYIIFNKADEKNIVDKKCFIDILNDVN